MEKKYYISCYQPKNEKRWICRVRWYDEERKLHSKYFTGDRKKYVKAAGEEFIKLRKDEENKLAIELTLEAWMAEWLDLIIGSVKPKTLEYYTYLTNTYIVPAMGNLILNEILPKDIQKMLNNLKRVDGQDKELAKSTKNGVRATLKAAFKSAEDNHYVSWNPVKATKPQKGKEKKIKAFTQVQMNLLLDIAKNKDYVHSDDQQNWKENDAQVYLRELTYYFLEFAAGTGMREGEIFALEWSDIDFEAGTVSVTKTVNYNVITQPKSQRSTRTVEITPKLVEELKEWKRKQDAHAEKYEGVFKNRNIVFADSQGNYRNVRNFRFRYWNKLCQAAGLEEYGIHSIRHYFATAMIDAGVPIAEVSRALGHANVSITMTIYADHIDKLQKNLINALKKLGR